MAKARDARGYRRRAWVAALDQKIDTCPWEKAAVHATFYHKHERRRDDVNHLAMLKPAYDGIVDAGLLEDDDEKHLTTLGASFGIDKENPRVEIRIVRQA